MKKVELHCHTNASDGMRTPQQLVEAAVAADISVLALTDHDTMDHVDEVAALCRETSIRFIPGIELSCWNGLESVHILGYFKNGDHRQNELQEVLAAFQQKRRERARMIRDLLLRHYRIEIDLDELDMRQGASIGRANLAALIGEKYNLGKDEIFARYLGDHSRAFIPSSDMPPADGIRLLNQAGALAILAHPGELRKTKFSELFGLAFDGAECYYPNHTPQRTREFIRACLARNRFITCGSDDHGIPRDQKHGTLGSTPFAEAHLKPFLDYMDIQL